MNHLVAASVAGEIIGAALLTILLYSLFKFLIKKAIARFFVNKEEALLIATSVPSFFITILVTYLFQPESFATYMFLLPIWIVLDLTNNRQRRKIAYLSSVLFLIVILFLIFRWDYGPEIQQNGIAFQNKTDRWTGVQWVKTYGQNGIKEEPVIEQARVQELGREIGQKYAKESGLWDQIAEMDRQIEEGKKTEPRSAGLDEDGNFFISEWSKIEDEKHNLISDAEKHILQLTIDELKKERAEVELGFWFYFFYFLFAFFVFFFSSRQKQDTNKVSLES